MAIQIDRVSRFQKGHAVFKASLNNSSAKIKKKTTSSKNNNLASGFFRNIGNFFLTLFGFPVIDNTPYENLYKQLKTVESTAIGEDYIKARAKYLFDKSSQAIAHANRQRASGKKPWEGLTPDIGTPMSAQLGTLQGYNAEQIYHYNCAMNFWAGAQLGIYESDKSGKIISVDDLDNTWRNKNFDPSDTWLVASRKELMWGRKIFQMGEQLRVSEWVNTARAPFPTVIQLVPEGLEKYITYGVLHGPFQERFGLSNKDQLEAAQRAAIVALNSSIIHKPDEPTQYSSKLFREAVIFDWLESEEGPRINGKTFRETYLSLIQKEGFSVFEPKGLPRYLLDTQKISGESYLPNYLQIIGLKEQYVDNRNKDISEEEGWRQFSEAVKRNVNSGICYWKEVGIRESALEAEKLNLRSQNFSEKEIEQYPDIQILKSELEQARKNAYKHIRLTGAERSYSPEQINYYQLLSDNPFAFYKKCTEGVLISPTVHFYDNHGTPIENSIEKIANIFETFGANVKIRRKVAELNSQSFNGNELHNDIVRFRNRGIEIYLTEGLEDYLRWRMCKYLEERFTAKDLENLTLKSGEKIFKCEKFRLCFSEAFIQKSKQAVQGDLITYKSFLNEELGHLDPKIASLSSIVESFIPEGKSFTEFEQEFQSEFSSDLQKLTVDSTRKNLLAEKRQIYANIAKRFNCFYPNELFSVNNTVAYDNSYAYNSILSLVIKRNALDPQGQYYVEVQPAREKHLGVPDFDEVLEKNLFLHTAGDSKSDICTIAAALERGGAASVIFNLVQEHDIYEEIFKQRKKYAMNFSEQGELFNEYTKAFGIFAIEETQNGYHKVTGFDSSGDKEYELDTNGNIKCFKEEELLDEIKNQCQNRIFRFSSPESYVRARAEIFGLMTGENIEFDSAKFYTAKEIYTRKQRGEKITAKERELLNEYEWAIYAELSGNKLPQEAPHFEVFREWRGCNEKGNFAVYRSKSHNGELVIDRLNGSKVELYKPGEEGLKNLKKVEIFLNDRGYYVYNNSQKQEVKYFAPERLKDYAPEHKLFLNRSKIKRFFNESFIRKLPIRFNALLKYCGGAVIALGGLFRLLSPLFGEGLKDSAYRTGYWLSNGVRALSAIGGALRGVLNVHKAYNITFGEIINIVSSFLPNGLKHMGLGFGNFILFLGRGQQRALMEQRINNHTRKELAGKASPDEFIDPRPFVREATKISSKLITKVKNEVRNGGMSALFGEIAGNIASSIVTPVKMLNDILHDPRLIFSRDERMSEKSGTYSKSIPSVGHLLTLTGILSGISAACAGLLGRSERVGELSEESGFNRLGSWTIALANMIPAIGIIANAKEVMTNKEGLPRIYRGVDGKDRVFNPVQAGLNQLVAGIGYLVVPVFGLENKYVASLFDIFTGQYFYGASGEELPNTNILSRSILRRNQELYHEQPGKTMLIKEDTITPEDTEPWVVMAA